MQIDLDVISTPKQAKAGQASRSMSARTKAADLAACSKRYGNAKDTIGPIEKGTHIHAVSEGEWSLHNTIAHVAEQIGPCDAWIATWSISEDAVRQLVKMRLDGKIRRMTMLVDWRVRTRRPGAAALAKENTDRIRVANCHAKAAVLRNDEYAVAIVTTANLTNNPRTEVYVLVEDDDIAAFHVAWIEDGIERGSKFADNVRVV